jgi:PKD repeat protein
MKKSLIFLLLVGGLLALIGGGGAVQGQGTSPLGIVPTPSELQVSIWVDKSVYQPGEYITVHYSVNQAAYIYIIDIDAANYARLIFPNRYSQDNYVEAGVHTLPDKPTYRFVVVPPLGTEYLQIIASTQPLPLDVQGFREAFPLLGTDPSQVGAQIQGIIPVGETATAWTSFQVGYGPPPPPPPPPPPSNRPPVASFTWNPYYPVVGQAVFFDASASYDPDGWITTYQWDFNNDGFIDAWGRTATYTFYTAGGKPVTLTVIDNGGASSSTTRTVWVQGYVPPPPPPPPVLAPGFYINIEAGNILHITVQGSYTWWTNRGYQIDLETDGCFTSVRHEISGGVVPLGIVPTPAPQSTLTLSGSVSTGKVDYYITLSCNATKIKFKLQLDWDGDGDLDLRTDNIYIGPSRRNPPSNPFVLHFPSGALTWVTAQICWVLVDQPGFRFIICFTFTP